MLKLGIAFLALLLLPWQQALAQLTDSGPVSATANGQVIENLRITANGQPCVRISGFSDVVIRNVDCLHSGAHGISASSAPRLRIQETAVTHTGTSVPLPSIQNNVDLNLSADLVATRVRVTGGSSGFYLQDSPGAQLSFIEHHNARGPFPRGQAVQFNRSGNCILQDFSSVNDVDQNSDRVAWTEDNVSVFDSDGCIVRRGLLDGNNSPSGVGVMFEGAAGGLAEDVDTIRMGNGSIFAYPSDDVTMRRTRARENTCTGWDGRGAPSSNALVWGGEPSSSNIVLEQSQYFALCNPGNLVWDQNVFTVIDIESFDFTPRPPLVLELAWEGGDPPPPPPPADTVAPEVSWISPQNGACLLRGAQVTVQVHASDEGGVDGVDFLLDGSLQHSWAGQAGSDTYTHLWSVPGSGGQHQLTVEAFDMAGNEAAAAIQVRFVKNQRQCRRLRRRRSRGIR